MYVLTFFAIQKCSETYETFFVLCRKHEINCKNFSIGRKQAFKNQYAWCVNSSRVKYPRTVAEIKPEKYKLHRMVVNCRYLD